MSVFPKKAIIQANAAIDQCVKNNEKLIKSSKYDEVVDLFQTTKTTLCFVTIYMNKFTKLSSRRELIHFLLLTRELLNYDTRLILIDAIHSSSLLFSHVSKPKSKPFEHKSITPVMLCSHLDAYIDLAHTHRFRLDINTPFDDSITTNPQELFTVIDKLFSLYEQLTTMMWNESINTKKPLEYGMRELLFSDVMIIFYKIDSIINIIMNDIQIYLSSTYEKTQNLFKKFDKLITDFCQFLNAQTQRKYSNVPTLIYPPFTTFLLLIRKFPLPLDENDKNVLVQKIDAFVQKYLKETNQNMDRIHSYLCKYPPDISGKFLLSGSKNHTPSDFELTKNSDGLHSASSSPSLPKQSPRVLSKIKINKSSPSLPKSSLSQSISTVTLSNNSVTLSQQPVHSQSRDDLNPRSKQSRKSKRLSLRFTLLFHQNPNQSETQLQQIP
ncbi:hypothetical protein QTN25_005001 [Entamoeba marina]